MRNRPICVGTIVRSVNFLVPWKMLESYVTVFFHWQKYTYEHVLKIMEQRTKCLHSHAGTQAAYPNINAHTHTHTYTHTHTHTHTHTRVHTHTRTHTHTHTYAHTHTDDSFLPGMPVVHLTYGATAPPTSC